MKFTYTSGARPLEGYTIKRGVGLGGFGEVYYAVSDGGKEVALKLVQRNLDIELRGVAQCINLKHQNLVTLYDLRTNDVGEHFVVMEFVAGKSLSEILEEHPTGLPLDDVNRWLKGISTGIGYLHDKGIVHRDLKPGNVFIEDGIVKIGDYGLSKFITASRRSGQTESVGTVHYMAPEISRGKYDREIDIYATGIMLYEMITGHVPFDGESVGEILMKHLTAQPDVSKLPPPYDLVAQRALAKDPAERFRTMDEFAAGLNGRLSAPAAFASTKETTPYVSPIEPSPIANALGAAPALAAACNPPLSPPMSVPFWMLGVYEGMAGVNGILRFDGAELSLQFKVKDKLIGAIKSSFKDVRIQLQDIERIRFRRGWFRDRLILQRATFPDRVRLHISRRDRSESEQLVDAVKKSLAANATAQAARNRASPEALAGPMLGTKPNPAADFFRDVRTHAIHWYERPWSLKDYFLAALCMLGVAIAGTAAMGGILALLPGAIVAVGVALIVMKLTKKQSVQAAVASPIARPIVLNPVPGANPVPSSAVIMEAAMRAAMNTQEPPTPPSPLQPVRMAPAPRTFPARELTPKPIRTRLVEMSSAMLLTTMLSIIASVLAAGIMRLNKPEECALLAATCLAGCWAVLIPAKIWEGHHGDTMLRRLIMAAIGVGVGSWSSYLDGVLNVGWLNDPDTAPILFESMAWMPRMLADASFFGLVFMMPRWWLIADSRRPIKLNPWMIIVPCFWAWLVSSLWIRSYFDHVFWGVVVTGMVSGLVQLATPWEDPASRRRAV